MRTTVYILFGILCSALCVVALFVHADTTTPLVCVWSLSILIKLETIDDRLDDIQIANQRAARRDKHHE